MFLTFEEILEFKAEVRERFSVEVHCHDSCGGQSFSLDKADEGVRDYITQYLKQKGLHAVFSEDGIQFTV